MNDKRVIDKFIAVAGENDGKADVVCIAIDGELVHLPDGFRASIEDADGENIKRLIVLSDNDNAAQFAEKLRLVAALGKEITCFHAQIDKDELASVKDLLSINAPQWHENGRVFSSWTVYPHSSDADDEARTNLDASCVFKLHSID